MKKVIVCIDDELMILNSLKSQLTRNFGETFFYEFAQDASEGFELIQELNSSGYKVVLIVSDWLMPGVKGDEFLVNVHKIYPEITKLLLTGQASNEAILNAKKNANLKKALIKPWNEDELVTIIKNL